MTEKQIVHYRGEATRVGNRVVLQPVDHPSDRVSNTGPALTSTVISWNDGRIETLNTVYLPEEVAPLQPQAAQAVQADWKEAMLDALASACLDAPLTESPRSILARIVRANVEMALSPEQREETAYRVVQAVPLTDEQIEAIGHRKAWRYKKSSDPHHSDTYTFNKHTLIEFARAVHAVPHPCL